MNTKQAAQMLLDKIANGEITPSGDKAAWDKAVAWLKDLANGS